MCDKAFVKVCNMKTGGIEFIHLSSIIKIMMDKERDDNYELWKSDNDDNIASCMIRADTTNGPCMIKMFTTRCDKDGDLNEYEFDTCFIVYCEKHEIEEKANDYLMNFMNSHFKVIDLDN